MKRVEIQSTHAPKPPARPDTVTVDVEGDEASVMVWSHPDADQSIGRGVGLDELAARNLGYALLNAAEELARLRRGRSIG